MISSRLQEVPAGEDLQYYSQKSEDQGHWGRKAHHLYHLCDQIKDLEPECKPKCPNVICDIRFLVNFIVVCFGAWFKQDPCPKQQADTGQNIFDCIEDAPHGLPMNKELIL